MTFIVSVCLVWLTILTLYVVRTRPAKRAPLLSGVGADLVRQRLRATAEELSTPPGRARLRAHLAARVERRAARQGDHA